MSHLSVETHPSPKPVLLIFAPLNDFTKVLLHHYQKNFRIVFASPDSLPEEFREKDIHSIPLSVFHLFERIEDTIDYALVFLNKTSDKQYLERIVTKLSPSNSKVCCILPLEETGKFIDVIQTYKKNSFVSFSILGEIFGWEITTSPSPTVQLVHTALTKRSFTLTGNDLLPVYLISVEDALTGITSMMFSPHTSSSLFYLFYEHPQTLISIIHVLRRIEPEFSISFEEGDTTLEPVAPTREELESYIHTKTNLKGEYPRKCIGFEKSVEKLIDSKPVKKHSSTPQKSQHEKKAPPPKKRASLPKKIVILPLLALLVVIVLFHALSIAATGYLYTRTNNALKNGDYTTIATTLPQLKKTLTLLEPSVTISSYLVSLFDKNNSLLSSYKFARDTVDVATILSEEFTRLVTIQKGLSKEEFEAMISNITFAYFELQRLKNETAGQSIDSLGNENYSDLLSLTPVLPTLLGYEEDRTYLLLFQNNSELRPTGGFIGSVGEITFSKGKITDFTIKDVYDLDGQLTQHFEPHYIIRRNLQPHLYLRDSNFMLNFEDSAKQSALIYEAITKKQVDGVIALDYEVLRRAVEELGPITLPGHDQPLTGDTMLDFLHTTIQSEFFPGSTQKKDTLTSVFNQLTLRLEENPSLYFRLAHITPSLLREKHILFAFPDETTQKIFSANNFSSNLVDPRSQQSGQIRDILSINEANVGGNKANTEITRSVEYKVALQKESILSRAIITLDNSLNSKDPYKSYVRVVAPYKSSLVSIKINGEEQTIIPAVTDSAIYEKRGFSPPPGLEVDNVYEYGYQIFGFTTTVPISQKSVIEIAYTNGITPRLGGVIDYSLYYIKQPGTEPYPLVVTLSFPEGYEAKNTNASTFAKNFVTFDSTVTTDSEFTAKLQKRASSQ